MQAKETETKMDGRANQAGGMAKKVWYLLYWLV